MTCSRLDRLIGGVGLDGTTGDSSEEPALGYWVGQPYWGNGYAREATAALIDYRFRTCMGLFLSSSSFWFVAGSLFGAGRPFFVPSPGIRLPERAEGVKGPKR
jgi:hypothetical protein